MHEWEGEGGRARELSQKRGRMRQSMRESKIVTLIHDSIWKQRGDWLLLKLPLLSAHGALLVELLGLEPLHDAVNVEAVRALTPDQRAVIPRQAAVRAAAIKGHAADPTAIVICHPAPSGHARPPLHSHLHHLREGRCEPLGGRGYTYLLTAPKHCYVCFTPH